MSEQAVRLSKGVSKAKTLHDVSSRVDIFCVPELLVFDASSYFRSPEDVLEEIIHTFSGRQLVVRSSAFDEDGEINTRAGEYDSILNVSSDDSESIRSAIEAVIDSYGRANPGESDDEIIVQEMVMKTSMSGVIFTHDLNTGAPYYVINYDDVSGLTNTVTSGDGEYANRTLYIHRGALNSLRSERFQRLMQATQELEQILDSQFLDIEFALGEDYSPYLLQVRPITTQPSWDLVVADKIDSSLHAIQKYVGQRFKPMEGVYGRTTVLGQMPDWNPAEMIGRAPRALAYSLYSILITDQAWRTARRVMGYAVPDCQPLMISLAGQPFIDTRLSFHSYLPAEISPAIGEKLVDVWVRRLREHPELHDKIEFEVAITAFSFDIDEKIETLIGSGLNQSERSEFKKVLRQQLRGLLEDSNEGSIAQALAKIDSLANKQNTPNQLSGSGDISILPGLIEDCINMGTVPFSILARHGFIARIILLSLNKRGILSKEDVDRVQSGVKTVAGKLVSDMHSLQLGELSRDDFMTEYGHLRPGTYDILSQRYDQMSDIGRNESIISIKRKSEKFCLSDQQTNDINCMLEAEGFVGINAKILMGYIEKAIVGREYGKFVFTRSVSEMLELIASYGEQHNIGRSELSHIAIDDLLDVAEKNIDNSIEDRLREISKKEAAKHAVSRSIRLPQVLFDEEGVHVVPFQVSQPNFITLDKITASSAHLTIGRDVPELMGKIVLIENADPGFDWIFSRKISGLITKYGGANSHMAIRCAEFGIPAAIGCGEQRFESLENIGRIHLDCAAGLISPIH